MEPRPPDRGPGRIIFLNGASSSGKSTLAKAMQQALPEPFLHVSSDHLVASGMLPARRDTDGPFAWWQQMRPRFFDGFHRCLPALAAAGNDLIVEHIIEFRAWREYLASLLGGLDVFLVGVHCELAEIDRRERDRRDHRAGEGRSHVETDLIHTFGPYDLEVDTTHADPAAVAASVLAAWRSRPPRQALGQGVSGNRRTLSGPAATGSSRQIMILATRAGFGRKPPLAGVLGRYGMLRGGFPAHEGQYMPYIALNSAEPGIRGLLRYRPETGRPLSELAEVLLRGPGTLTRGERELIAAYVSALNDCRYCTASHSACAAAQLPGGIALVEQVRSDASSAPVPAKLAALLAIAAAVQQGGLEVTAELVARARTADATDLEIHDTVLIAAAFCMFNRYVDGLATIAPDDPALYAAGAQRLIKDGYLPPAEPSRQD